MTVSILPGHRAALDNERTATLFLDDDTDVPTTDVVFRGGFAFKGSTNELYVCLTPAGGAADQNVYYRGGKPVRGDGAMIVAEAGTPAYYIHGIALTADFEVCADENAPDRTPNDIGTSEDGLVSVTNVD
jgi:hypothetical protein